MTNPSSEAKPKHMAFIDGLRAVAVLSVIASHVGKHNIGQTMESWGFRLSQIGGHGVELFFVISGFCLAMPYLRQYQATMTTAFNGPKFFASRIFRILPPYYIAVVFFALLSATALWHATALNEHGMTQRLTFTSLAAHAFFTQRDWELLNGSFWTLRIEAIWYLLFPLCLWLFVKNRASFFGVACLSGGLAILPFFQELGTIYKLALALPAFMLGILAADMHLRNTFARRIVWSAFILTGGLAFVGEFEWLPWGRLAWALFAFALIVLASNDKRVTRLLSNPLLVATGIASYSIYLIHEPIIAMLEYIHVTPIVACGCGLLAGFGFWWLVERPLLKDFVRQPATKKIRWVIEGFLQKVKPVPELTPAPVIAEP